jgi:hypothetical protein
LSSQLVWDIPSSTQTAFWQRQYAIFINLKQRKIDGFDPICRFCLGSPSDRIFNYLGTWPGKNAGDIRDWEA